jgi:fumarylacetoacetase
MIHFPSTALPYGAFSQGSGPRRLGVGLGTDIVDLEAASDAGAITSIDPALLRTGRLNDLLAAGRPTWTALREELLASTPALRAHTVPQSDATMHLAWDVPDYVDFFSSRHHAENCGTIFGRDLVLSENWLHLPVGYHGRCGTIVVDGTPVRRPQGQRREADGTISFGRSERLDVELELGWVLGGQTNRGEPVPIDAAADHIFGLVLLNDWSARDIQAWEAVPLGPFLGKSFATSVSAWIMPIDAMDAARRPNATQTEQMPFPYLQTEQAWGFDLDCEVRLRPNGEDEALTVAKVNAAEALYWNPAQQLAHMTVNGASVRPGDLYGSGTLSGPQRHQRGSFLEMSWGGTEEIDVAGHSRMFLEDGDEVTLAATFPGPDGPVPLGPVSGVITPALSGG